MDLTLVTCNIRFDNPADGENSWSHRRLFLRDVLLSHSPDIIATQEGRYHQLQDLNTLLTDYELVDQHRSWIGERMYPTFFIRKNRFEMMKSEDIWLSETPDVAGTKSFGSAFPRLLTWMKVQPVNSANDLWFVNTHLDHLKEETRLGQIRVLTTEVKKFWKKEDALFVLGDFNDGPESGVRKHLFNELELQDCWNGLEETSHHAFQGEIPNGQRIDWILVDRRVTVLDCEMDKTSREGKYPTDHFPVIAKIRP